MNLKFSAETKLIPSKLDHPYIAAIYDPYDLVQFDYTSWVLLYKYDIRVLLIEKYQTAPSLNEHYLTTMVLRCLLTPNLYVFHRTGYPTNALLVLEENQINVFLEIMELFGLYGLVYSPLFKPVLGYINMNYEDKNQNHRWKQKYSRK